MCAGGCRQTFCGCFVVCRLDDDARSKRGEGLSVPGVSLGGSSSRLEADLARGSGGSCPSECEASTLLSSFSSLRGSCVSPSPFACPDSRLISCCELYNRAGVSSKNPRGSHGVHGGVQLICRTIHSRSCPSRFQYIGVVGISAPKDCLLYTSPSPRD